MHGEQALDELCTAVDRHDLLLDQHDRVREIDQRVALVEPAHARKLRPLVELDQNIVAFAETRVLEKDRIVLIARHDDLLLRAISSDASNRRRQLEPNDTSDNQGQAYQAARVGSFAEQNHSENGSPDCANADPYCV